MTSGVHDWVLMCMAVVAFNEHIRKLTKLYFCNCEGVYETVQLHLDGTMYWVSIVWTL